MATTSVLAAVGIGSNLADPVGQVTRALLALETLPGSALVARSSLYRSAPMGPPDQPDYINAAALVRTELSAHEFLDALQAIERAQGRDRSGVRWGARTIDLDLLLWGEREIDDSRLTVPHPGVHERAFVLYPLDEIGASLVVPRRGRVSLLKQACRAEGLTRLDDTLTGIGARSER